MKMNNLLQISTLIMLFSLNAAWAGASSMNGVRSTLPASQKCIQCHAAPDPTIPTISPITGSLITGDWLKSPHNTQSPANTTRFGSSCQNCHGTGHNHPNSCSQCHGNTSPMEAEFINPDGALQCNKCHGPRAKRKPAPAPHYPVITKAMKQTPTIWTNMSTAGYVTAKSTRKCRFCHDPHDNTLLQQNRDWAKSGHGDTKAWPWIHYDFKSRDICNRCHTTTGFAKYLATGNTTAWAKVNSADKTKEVLRCDGCHLDYSWKRKAGNTKGLDGVQLPYGSFDSTIGPYGKAANNDTSTVIKDAGNANLCINCHSGLASGRAIALGDDAKLLHNSFGGVNSHYFAAAGDLYAIAGYEYLPHDQYQLIDPVTGVNFFEHDGIGLDGTIGLGTDRGPCVGCHMDDKRHTFLPIELSPVGSGPRSLIDGTITAFPAVATSCGKCHTIGGPHDLSFGAASDIRDRKKEYKDRLAELENLLNTKFGIVYDPDFYPYFWPDTVTDHTNPDYAYGSPGKPTAVPPVPAQLPWPDKGVLGAAFNLNTCFRDPGGYAHNNRYTSRLIYDSLDYLDDGLLNNSYISSAFPARRPL